VNKKGRSLLGIADNDPKGLKVYDYEKYFTGNRLANWERHVLHLKEQRYQEHKGNIINYSTGEQIPTDVVLNYIVVDGVGYVLAISRDVRERHKLEAIMAQKASLQDVLLRMASTYINVDLDGIDAIINNSLKEIGQFVNADRAYIFSYNFLEQTTTNTFEWCNQGISPEIANLKEVPTSFFPEWLKRHKKRQSFNIYDVCNMPDTGPNGLKAILQPQGVKSIITIPMLNKGRLVGFVGFDSVKEKKRYTQREEHLLSVYAEILVNIEARQQYEVELVNQKERFNKIIGSIDLGLVEMDGNFNIIFANQSFINFYMYKWSSLLGKNFFDLFLPNGDQGEIRAQMLAMEYKEVRTDEVEILDSKGVVKPVFASIVKHFHDKGITRYLGAFVDLSPQKQLEKELREAMQRTEEASRAKEQFFANMSHELRTPLNIINGSLTEVAKQRISKDAKFLLSHANAASRHMLNLVNNILDFATINAGELSLDRKKFDLLATVKATFDVFKLMADEKDLDYSLAIDKGIHSHVAGDYGKLNQVLINILGNAIKFTDKGGVLLRLKLIRADDTTQKIRFTVTDTGVGMSPEFLSRIFEAYQQDSLENSLQIGTGLGMPISKKLLEVMGGDIEVASIKNEGTTIHFNLDFEKKAKINREESILMNKTLLENKYILIAEDNFMNAIIIERKITELGAKVLKVTNGKEAVAALKKQKFDLVLMDIQMPVMNGVEATKIIRKELRLKLPIVAITANVFKSSMNQYLDAGIDDIIVKPFDDETLRKIILKQFALHTIPVLKKSTQAPKRSGSKLYDLDKLVELSGGDQDFYSEMIKVFLKVSHLAIKELTKAIKEENIADIGKTVHRISPSIKEVRITTAVTLADALEASEYKDKDFVLANAPKLLHILSSAVAQIVTNEL